MKPAAPSEFIKRGGLVAGAGGGMGLAIANSLIEAGANIVLADIKPEPANIADGPGRAIYLQGDLSQAEFSRQAVSRAQEHAGRFDFLVNTVGVWWGEEDVSLVDIDLGVWDRVFENNLDSMMLTARHAVPLMQKNGGGAMLLFSSIQALRGDALAQDAYSASKGAIRALSKSFAIQFAGDNIRCNTIVPGYVWTGMMGRLEGKPERRQEMQDIIPLKRFGTVADIAGACLFLLSDSASFITGTELIIDGGTTARP
ncbi:MAG: SDR family oxidoreductase [Rhodospirillaceae bacterium]|nr:SDR family oxidoreductase [Rhodospirillaceae bacterium]MBT5037423.1 SDR family oxidoreductase [Rhodospirillaceae bacterium]MBT5677082.1 SDR family oxidoreductase [Rhodospirillaceae bacterium]